MKKTSFGGYPWLCLCLIFPAILCSCAVKRSGATAEKYAVADTPTTVWKIEVFMMPVKWMPWTSGNEVETAFQPYNVKETGISGNAQILQLTFRTNNEQQLNTLREQLFATGVVEQVNVTKESN